MGDHPRSIIVNADGFGFTPGVNRGILETLKFGIVKSVSCNANFDAIEDLPELIAEFPQVSVGVHFNLSVGSPVCDPAEVPSLVGRDGTLLGEALVPKLLTGKIRQSEIEAELEAQALRMEQLGARISHWDGHENKHLYPQFFWAAMGVAKNHSIEALRTHRRYLFLDDPSNRLLRLSQYYVRNPRRILTHVGGRTSSFVARRRDFKMADRLISPSYADASAKQFMETWLAMMQLLPAGVNEIYCHPGYPDDLLRAHADYVDERADEVALLTSPELMEAISDRGIRLLSFWDL